jgi:uncharacterized membrane protein
VNKHLEMHKMTGWALVGLEIMWLIGWIILLGFGHASTEPSALEYRHQITFLIFHPLTNFVLLLYILRNLDKPRESNMVMIFVFLFGIAVDVNTMVETILHLPQANHMWAGMMALSISAVAISALTTLWYFWQLRKKKHHHNYNKMSDRSSFFESNE